MQRSLLIFLALCATCIFAPRAKAEDVLAKAVEMDYSGKADTLTTVLIRQFLNSARGTFWAVPSNRSNRDAETTYIYWQQAHAMDAIIYSYQRIKDTKNSTAASYERYMKLWYNNHANNWYHADNDPTGFMNEYTDDMCWICLTLLHMSEALGDNKYADTAKQIFDNYIQPRGWTDDSGFWALPWKLNDMGRNACTNAPGSLVASKLYLKYGGEQYKQAAIDLCKFLLNEMKTKMNNDGRVEEPPLTYTQGTFAEACRQLYHITGESAYLQTAQKVVNYMLTSSRCTYKGILRDEGSSMDQSIFKAVAIPYAVNMVLDESVSLSYRRSFLRNLQTNAKTLWSNLDLDRYPYVYCNYYWGEPIDQSAVPSMGAMVSGVSLMENVARMALELTKADDEAAIRQVDAGSGASSAVYTLDGRLVAPHSDRLQSLPSGLYIADQRKVIVR